MVKTPDIIKKGLESCNKGWQYCRECPYYTVGCDIVLCGDALEYIKQLEADLAIERKRTDALAIELSVYKTSKAQKEESKG